jgi:hypothetical protein
MAERIIGRVLARQARIHAVGAYFAAIRGTPPGILYGMAGERDGKR